MREQQVVTTARSVPVRQRLTPVTGTFWFPRASAESDVLSAAGPPSVKCRTSRHGDTQKPRLAEELGFSLSKGAACRKGRPGERSVEPCPTTAPESCVPTCFFPVPPAPGGSLSWPRMAEGQPEWLPLLFVPRGVL